MTASQTAIRKGINNNPSEDHMNALKALCENVLQKVRTTMSKVVTISAGIVVLTYAKQLAQAKSATLAKGQAADFEVFGLSNAELVKWISENCEFDQMILEFHNLDEPNSGWVHCSYRADGENRKQILRAYKNESNKTCYESYVPS